MPVKRGGAAKGKTSKGGGSGAAGSTLLPQEWNRFSDNDTSKRVEDLAKISKFVEELHGQANGDGLYSALLRLHALQGVNPRSLHEVRFVIALGNEAAGLDKNGMDALVLSIARDIAGTRRAGQPETDEKIDVEIDTKIPNSDIRVTDVDDSSNPANPAIPEIRVGIAIVANDATHAQQLVERILNLVEDNGKVRLWNNVLYRIVDELDKSDSREYDESKYLRLVTTPTIDFAVTDFIKFSEQPEPDGPTPSPKLPSGSLPVRVMVMGGRDPYKNDLVKWLVGIDPHKSFRSHSLEKQHSFTVVSASQFPDDWRSYRLAMRVGKLDATLRAALKLNYAELKNQFDKTLAKAKQDGDEDARKGSLTKEWFIATLQSEDLKLVGTRGEQLVVPASSFEELFAAADVDNDGSVSLHEFLALFRNKDSEGASGGGGKKRANIGNADPEDQDNQDSLVKLQQQVSDAEAEVAKQKEYVKARDAQIKALATAKGLRETFKRKIKEATEKIQGCQRAIAENQAKLENPEASQKDVQKANKDLKDAQKKLSEATKALKVAQAQHEKTLDKLAAIRDPRSTQGGAGKQLDQVHEVEDKLREVIGTGARLMASFAEFDDNNDGKLSLREAATGIGNFLGECGFKVPAHLVMQILAKLDDQGDGFIDLHEFMEAFDPDEVAKAKREQPSLDGLPCRATYTGGSRVPTFPKDHLTIWRPSPQEDQEAANKQYDAVITKRLSATRFRVTFVHSRIDPLAPQEEPEQILYHAFKDFPDKTSFISQEVSLEDIWLEGCMTGTAAVQNLCEARLRVQQQHLIDTLQAEMKVRAEVKGSSRALLRELYDANKQGPRGKVLDELVRLWKDNYANIVPPNSARPKLAQKMHEATRMKIEQHLRFLQEEDHKQQQHLSAWKKVKRVAVEGEAPHHNIEQFASSLVTMSLRYVTKPTAPVIVQAPELLGVNAPLEEGVNDVIKTVRIFFGDLNSKDPLEKQIRKKFEQKDVNKSGGLDRKEMKALLRDTVNQGIERLSEHEMNNLIDILDADGSGSIEVEELLNAIKPRGSECPYEQMSAMLAMGDMVDKVLVLVDPQHTRFNPWEKFVIAELHARMRSKLVFAMFVTVEHQETFKTWANLSKTARASAEDIGAFLSDPSVTNELKDNIISVGTWLGKKAEDKLKWRVMPNALSQVVVQVFTHENEHVHVMLREMSDSVRVLKSSLLKAWRYFTNNIEGGESAYEIETSKNALALAAQGLCKTGELILAKVPKVAKDIVSIDCSSRFGQLMRLGKEAQKAGVMVLKEIRMDGATTADKAALERKARERRMRVQNAVRLNDTAEWTSEEYIKAWAELVVARCKLAPQDEEAFRDMLQARQIKRIGQLVHLDRATIARSLRGSSDPEEARLLQLLLWRQLNRVRANFWGLSMPSPVRSLWLLVREQYLCLEDLRLGYSILRGDVKVPGYWHTCFRDGLVLLTEGLDDQNLPLELVPVTAKVMLPYWDGSRREKEVTTSYFSDGHVASDGSGSRRGKVSAEIVAQMVLQIRKDVVETIGWAPAEDSDDE